MRVETLLSSGALRLPLTSRRLVQILPLILLALFTAPILILAYQQRPIADLALLKITSEAAAFLTYICLWLLAPSSPETEAGKPAVNWRYVEPALILIILIPANIGWYTRFGWPILGADAAAIAGVITLWRRLSKSPAA